jgi:hypothetical protein
VCLAVLDLFLNAVIGGIGIVSGYNCIVLAVRTVHLSVGHFLAVSDIQKIVMMYFHVGELTEPEQHFAYLLFPAFFTSSWLWLYTCAGSTLIAARRFDIGFDWFNRKFDIEKKPLQSIGLVAGALVAVVYWMAVIVGWLV